MWILNNQAYIAVGGGGRRKSGQGGAVACWNCIVWDSNVGAVQWGASSYIIRFLPSHASRHLQLLCAVRVLYRPETSLTRISPKQFQWMSQFCQVSANGRHPAVRALLQNKGSLPLKLKESYAPAPPVDFRSSSSFHHFSISRVVLISPSRDVIQPSCARWIRRGICIDGVFRELGVFKFLLDE